MTKLFKNLEFVHLRLKAFWQVDYLCRGWKSLKNQPRDVINMREMRGEVGKKTPKKETENPSFLWRHVADFWVTFSPYFFLPQYNSANVEQKLKSSLLYKTYPFCNERSLGALEWRVGKSRTSNCNVILKEYTKKFTLRAVFFIEVIFLEDWRHPNISVLQFAVVFI